MKKLELYFHIPFCVRKCNYCDFLSAPADFGTRAAYADLLRSEIRQQGKIYGQSEVTSIFVGGGTPTVLENAELAGIFKTLRECFNIAADAEITVECNPGTLDAGKLAVLKEAGVNRLSLGLQSALSDELLNLGRIHTFEKFLEEYENARAAGFSNINVDLMQALPGQTPEKALETLEKVLALNPEHISVYSLIVEEGTPFYELYGNHPEKLPDEDTEREIYYSSEKRLEEAGFIHYEISNYARPGLECRHNTGYWTGAEYLGLGLGAASYIGGRRFNNTRSLAEYLKKGGPCIDAESVQVLTDKDLMAEFMFLGLRLSAGISKSEFIKRFRVPYSEVYGTVTEKFKKLGLLAEDSDSVRLTKRGRDLSNSVMCEFLQE